MDKQPFKNIL